MFFKVSKAKGPAPTIYLDMDGVLARFPEGYHEGTFVAHMNERGFFENLEPELKIIHVIKTFQRKCPKVKVKILSKLNGSPFCGDEKLLWLRRWFPEMRLKDVILVPSDRDKYEFVRMHKDAFLIDDYSINLHSWVLNGGKGIKFLNGINGRFGTWQGPCISVNDNEDDIVNMLIKLTK